MFIRKLHSAICIVAATALMAGCGDDEPANNNNKSECEANEIKVARGGEQICVINCEDSSVMCPSGFTCRPVGTQKACLPGGSMTTGTTGTTGGSTTGGSTTGGSTTGGSTTGGSTTGTTGSSTTGTTGTTSNMTTSTTGTMTTNTTSNMTTSTTGTMMTNTNMTNTNPMGVEVGKKCNPTGAAPAGTRFPVSTDCDASLVCWPESIMTNAGTTPTGAPGGACTVDCTGDDTLCPADTACVPTGFVTGPDGMRESLNYCLESCNSSTDCSFSDQICVTFKGSADKVCVRSQMGAGAGAACTSGGACAGADASCTTEYPGGQCTSSCNRDSDCTAGANQMAHCTPGGTCKQTCTATTDCRQSEGYVCEDLDGDNINECVPDGDTLDLGGACTSMGFLTQGTCNPGRTCYPEEVPLAGGTTAPTGYPGGYCTILCIDDPTVCGAGAACLDTQFTIGRDPQGNPIRLRVCGDPCTMASDCRQADGYTCADTDGDSVADSCQEAPGSQNLGDSCGRDQDCGGIPANGICWPDAFNGGDLKTGFPGGYCTVNCTMDPNVCGVGSVCTDTGITQGAGNPTTKICTFPCAANADCREAEGYACVDSDGNGTDDSCLIKPDAQIGEACVRGQCDNGGLCLNDGGNQFLNGYCTLDCAADPNVCAAGSTCRTIAAIGSGTLCYDDCTADTDCRQADGYTCVDTDNMGGVDTCLRVGSGAGLVGDACTGVADCAGGLDASCLAEFTDNMGMVRRPGGACSLACTQGAMPGMPGACAAGSSCVTFGMAPNTIDRCVEDCVNNMCDRMGFQCRTAGAGINVCL